MDASRSLLTAALVVTTVFLMIIFTGFACATPQINMPNKLLAAANNPPQTLDLRVENQVNPDRLTTFYPIFSWTFYDPDGDSQTNFHVWVGSSPGNADLWNSGTVHSSSNWVVYDGKPLQRGETYHLQVRTRDGKTWSDWATATFRINRLPIVSNLSVSGDEPIIRWTYHDPDGDRQSHFRIQVWTWFFVKVWDTGPVAGDNTSVKYNYNGTGAQLKDGKTYYVCVWVKDGYEWSWPVWTQFTVDIPPVITRVYVQGYPNGSDGILHITDNTPDISWDYYDPGDTQTNYHVEVWTGPGRTGTLMDNSYIVSSSKTTYTYGSSPYAEFPLICGENYHVSVRAMAGNKWSGWFEAKFRMNTPPIVSGLRVENYGKGDARILRITDRTPEIGWKYADNDGDNQAKYWLRVWRLPSMDLTWDSGPVDSRDNWATCENTLVDGENYMAGVRAKDGYEWSSENFIEFRINSKPSATNLSVGGFPTPIVRWEYSDRDWDRQCFYQVQFWSGPGGTGDIIWDSGVMEGSSASLAYGGAPLVDGKTYYVRIRVNDNYEWSDWTEISFIYGSEPLNPRKLGAINLSTANAHYPNQVYVHEGGAVILVQDGIDMMISPPSMITFGKTEDDNIWIKVRWVLIETNGGTSITGGVSTVLITNVENFVRVRPSGGANRKEVTITVGSQYKRAWNDYLSKIAENLARMGCVVNLDNLRLTIYGKDPDVKDIYFTEEVTRFKVSIL